MSRRFFISTTIVLGAALVWAAMGSLVASSAPTLQFADFSAPAFTPVQKSSHNGNGSNACGITIDHADTAPQVLGEERTSDLNAIKGSYIENVRLPQGITVKKLTIFANDADADTNVHVYLVRKRIADNLNPRFQGYRVMAHAASSGAVIDTMRKFTDTSITKPVLDNSRFVYFLEMVNCGPIEPFAAQIAYTG